MLVLALLGATAANATVSVVIGPGRVELQNGLVTARLELVPGTLFITTEGVTLGPFLASAEVGATTLSMPFPLPIFGGAGHGDA